MNIPRIRKNSVLSLSFAFTEISAKKPYSHKTVMFVKIEFCYSIVLQVLELDCQKYKSKITIFYNQKLFFDLASEN